MPSTTAAVRYGLPALVGVAGIAIALAGSGTDTALEGGSMFVGAGLSVVVLNLLFRFETSGDVERDAEEAARRYLDEHGHWPDEPPPTSGRASPNTIADAALAGGSRCAGPITDTRASLIALAGEDSHHRREADAVARALARAPAAAFGSVSDCARDDQVTSCRDRAAADGVSRCSETAPGYG
jgi:hypothetical protein